MRRAARTDANMVAIIAALRRVGAQVEYIKEPLDLLVASRTRTLLMECKTEGGRFTKAQVEFMARWPGEIQVCNTVESAVAAYVNGEKKCSAS